MKLAGDEAKDRMYEPKHKKKLVRVLTVVAYVFFVSLAAIMLSLYYVLIWNGHQKETVRVRSANVPITVVRCSNEGTNQSCVNIYIYHWLIEKMRFLLNRNKANIEHIETITQLLYYAAFF